MTRSPSRLLPLTLATLLPLFAVACDGGSDENVTMDSAALTCDVGTFRLTGSIDDMSVDVTQPAAGGGFDQLDGGDFGSTNNGLHDDPTLTDLHATWPQGIVDGATTAATATVKIPRGPFPNDVFCAGNGSTVHVVPDAQGGGLQFRLASLASGASCATPHRGTLRACWRPTP
jgi:hypothetical protein